MTNGKKRYISSWIWEDSYFISLQKDEKLVWIYLLTNQNANIAGIYEITFRKMAFDLGMNNDRLNEVLSKFEIDKKAVFYENYIIIKNFTKHQKIAETSTVRKGIDIILEGIPDDIYKKAIEFGYIYKYIKHIDKLRIEESIKTKIGE